MEEVVLSWIKRNEFLFPATVYNVLVQALNSRITKGVERTGTFWKNGEEHISYACDECGRGFKTFGEITRYCPDCGQKLGRY